MAGVARPDEPDAATENWVGAVLLEGWTRRMARTEVAELVGRSAGVRLHCALIESNDDHMVALAAELKDDFSLDVWPVSISPAVRDPAFVPVDVLAGADVVVTTVFHSEVGRAAAAIAGEPCIVVSINRQFAAEVNRRRGQREVTAVISDPRYGARAKTHLEVTPHRGYVHFVLVDDVGAPQGERVDLESDAVLVTRAARQRLGLPEYHLVPSPPPYISADSARELFHAIVRLSLNSRNAAPG